MNRSTTRVALLVCVVVGMLIAATPGNACECLDRLMPWNWGRGTGGATTYAPPYNPGATVAPTYAPMATASCAPCAAKTGSSCTTQTCSYVPQTCYRTVYRTVPVSTCQTMTGCDPCTGCPVTYYRPVTTYQRCAQRIPYTTYRMVWSNPCATSCSSCGTCGSSCGSSCGTSSCGTNYYGTSAGCSSGCSSGGCSSGCTPSYVNSTQQSPAKTFVAPPAADSVPNRGSQQYQQNKPISEPGVAPIPDPDSNQSPGVNQQNSTESLKLNQPENNPTARRPIRQVSYLVPNRPVASVHGPVDYSGWRSVNK